MTQVRDDIAVGQDAISGHVRYHNFKQRYSLQNWLIDEMWNVSVREEPKMI